VIGGVGALVLALSHLPATRHCSSVRPRGSASCSLAKMELQTARRELAAFATAENQRRRAAEERAQDQKFIGLGALLCLGLSWRVWRQQEMQALEAATQQQAEIEAKIAAEEAAKQREEEQHEMMRRAAAFAAQREAKVEAERKEEAMRAVRAAKLAAEEAEVAATIMAEARATVAAVNREREEYAKLLHERKMVARREQLLKVIARSRRNWFQRHFAAVRRWAATLALPLTRKSNARYPQRIHSSWRRCAYWLRAAR